MGVEKRHSHVKFSRTIRLGKNTDLDNAAAGSLEVGSLRDNGTHIQRWNGTFWENIGAPLIVKDITFADTPYLAKVSEDIIFVNATGGDVVVTPPLSSSLKKEQTVIMVSGETEGFTVDVVPSNDELISGVTNRLLSVNFATTTYVSDNTQLIRVA